MIKALAPLPYEPQFQGIYARLLCVELRSRAIDPAPLLASVGIEEHRILGSDAWVSSAQFLALCAAAKTACNDPELSLCWAQRVTENVHGLAGTAVITAPDFRTAMDTFQRMTVLRNTAVSIEFRKQRDKLQYVCELRHPLGELHEFVYTHLALSFSNILKILLSDQISNLCIDFPFAAPPWMATAHRFFPCALRYGAENLAFCLPDRLLDYKNPVAQPVAHAAALRQCEMEVLGLEADLVARVKTYLLANAEHPPSAETAAKVLSISPRSLRRELEKAGTGYRQLVLSARMGAAHRYLEDTRLTIEQIAWQIGYADTSNFIRTFRKICQLTPEQYRQSKRERGN